MKRLDGMETAQPHPRSWTSDVLLIFITNMAQYAIKGYSVGALDYVLKPVPYFAFSQQLQKAVSPAGPAGAAVPGSPGGRWYAPPERPPPSIIWKVTAIKRLPLHRGWRISSVPGALKAFEEKLANRHGFARCNSGYLVNLAQVHGVQQSERPGRAAPPYRSAARGARRFWLPWPITSGVSGV